MAINLSDGFSLPDIPTEIKEQYPYVVVQKITHESGGVGYSFRATDSPYFYVGRDIIDGSSDNLLLQVMGDDETTALVSPNASKGTFYSYNDDTNTWDKLLDLTVVTPCPIGNTIGESGENLGYYELVWSNHNIYELTSYNDNTKEYAIGNGIYFENSYLIKTSDRHYKAIASKVREILGESTQYRPRDLSDAIRSTSSLLNPYEINRGVIFRKESIPTAITTDTLYPGAYNDVETECFFIPQNIIKIAPYAFSLSDAKEVRFHDKVTTIFDYAFNAAGITTLNLPNSITSIGKIAFATCSDLVNVIINSATIPSLYGTFYQCRVLERIDIKGKVTTIDYNAFAECNSLNTLIIRGSSCASLANVNAFTNTPIASGTGYIYVPSTLLSSYKSATRWSTYAAQFRAIEDYPEICDPTE